MRLHALEVSAFGPFAETVAVDFDALGAAGLFLLTGPTGAGKTSVLDAVCFGLYGEVPGDRAGARHLRSDHAAPDAEPRVVLRFSVGQRSFRFSRSPAWDRPKRRGSGTRRIQAAVVAEELRESGWVAVSTRLDETGQLVGELLGMTCAQFTQVALLPQGRFQAFLRASSPERHALLQRLFRTGRYDDVERWLGDQRLRSRRESARGHDACLAVLDRLCEAAATELPTDWETSSPAHLGVLVDDGRLDGWVAMVREGAASQLQHHESLLRDAEDALAAAVRAQREAEQAAAVRLRGEQATRRLAQLAEQEPDVARAELRLAHHAAALPLQPILRRVERASLAAARESAAAAAARQRLEAAAVGVDDSPGALESARAEVERLLARAEGWRPRERELETVRAQLDTALVTCERLTARLSETESAQAETQARLHELATERDRLAPVAALAPTAAARVARAQAATEAATALDAVRSDLAEAWAEHARLTEVALARKERWLELREQRISGMAAELATGLAAGCSCPVCGSPDHPAPAVSTQVVGRDEEEAAREEHESAEVLAHAVGETVSGLRSRESALLPQVADGDVAHWEQETTAAEEGLAAARADQERLAQVGRALSDREHEQQRLVAAQARLAAQLQAAQTGCTQLGERVETLETELVELLAGAGGATSVSSLLERLCAERTLLDEVAAALRTEADAVAALRESEAAAADALAVTDFESLAACAEAVLDPGEAESSTERVAAWHQERQQTEHTLADPEVARALAAEPCDPAPLAEAARQLHELRDRHLAAARAAAARAERLEALHADLRARLAAWLPDRRRHDTVAALAGLVDGTSPDNALRMRLSGYVLAERLRQVVSAANLRLAAMTDERFALEQSDEKAVGERRGGLSLRVRDDWSGTRRDPATLSGGESFVVSLALALGLADTVAHEAGGATIETLFVDEGFGALDTDTLDAVMEVLDALRDGGRVVGIVSHVAELRARVGAQLEVAKTRSGSTLRPVLQPG